MEDCYKMLHNLTNNLKKAMIQIGEEKKGEGTQNKLNSCL